MSTSHRKTQRLTMAQALAKFLTRQMIVIDGKKQRIFAGIWGIFGHGNVAGLGEALFQVRSELPTYRGQNEQTMAHTAIAFAKASKRKRMMAVTSSIGPGATNMVTAAATAHVNRLPCLFLPGDVFATRAPDPVLQQVEDFGDGTVSANDCFKPVSRYFDRITRPEQIIPALHRAMQVLTDPAECGPVTLSLCQDVQAMAFDYPESFFDEQIWNIRRPRADVTELDIAVKAIKAAKNPVIIAGGGVVYSEATEALKAFAEKHGMPVAETHAGKSSLPAVHELNLGGIGVTGTAAANAVAETADVILAVGTRLQDFTTGSWALFKNPNKKIISLNVQAYDAAKHRALSVVGDAKVTLEDLSLALGSYQADSSWTTNAKTLRQRWFTDVAAFTNPSNAERPSDSQIVGAAQRALGSDVFVMNAAGSMPGEMHKLWQAGKPGSYHSEYGFSCMGYEIAGALGIKMARPQETVVCFLGDGSYMMANSELLTSVMLGKKIILLLTDNRGYGCINRLQHASGGERFNNLYDYNVEQEVSPEIDYVAHAKAMGAIAEEAKSIAELEAALTRAKANDRSTVVVIKTDPMHATNIGGHWWEVGVPEVSPRKEVNEAYQRYIAGRRAQVLGS